MVLKTDDDCLAYHVVNNVIFGDIAVFGGPTHNTPTLLGIFHQDDYGVDSTLNSLGSL